MTLYTFSQLGDLLTAEELVPYLRERTPRWPLEGFKDGDPLPDNVRIVEETPDPGDGKVPGPLEWFHDESKEPAAITPAPNRVFAADMLPELDPPRVGDGLSPEIHPDDEQYVFVNPLTIRTTWVEPS
tara:strand:+ start:1513 stop:1896 length:384 start_codon:yes stop_codon:yes gene_type:complete